MANSKKIQLKKQHLPTPSSFCLLALSILVTPITEAAANRKPVANAGIDQVTGFLALVVLNGKLSADPDGTVKKYQWLQTQGPKVTLTGALTASPTFRIPAKQKNQQPLTLAFTLTVTDNQNAAASDSVAITAVTGKLNDTGITRCSNGAKNGLICSSIGYPGQDAQTGQDATNNNNADGHAGFSFTKISGAGKILPANATSWNCVQDNVTGLMWEIKTNDNGLHDKDWIYTWYEPNNSKNGDNAGYQNSPTCGKTSACDTASYVQAINTAGWCGAKDWRMPTKKELHSIISYHHSHPSIDAAYFPNTNTKSFFWSSSPYAYSGLLALGVSFDNSVDVLSGKSSPNYIRLVRSSQ
jgi:hypothetical protein